MATIFNTWVERIRGGWKTVGAPGIGAFALDGDYALDTPVGPMSAMKLSAYYAAVRLVSETMGTLSFQLYDNRNNVVEDHDLYGLMRYDTNPARGMTGDGLVTGMVGNSVVYGNGLAHIKRYTSTGKVYGLDFYSTDLWQISTDREGLPTFAIDGEDVPREDVLHLPGFSLNGYWGLPSLVAAADVLRMQTESNKSAHNTFRSGLRAGGFFTLPENRQAFNNEQLEKFKTELQKMSRPENTAKWMPLLPGMTPHANASYRIDPVTAELLQSRYFGVEEICRFIGVPPPLIGHTDKASSWASSIENLNQFLVTYTIQPKATRLERAIGLKLLGRNERNRLVPKFNMDSLLRGDIEKRFKTYEIGRKYNIYSSNDVRAKENLPPREGGDSYDAPKQESPNEQSDPR